MKWIKDFNKEDRFKNLEALVYWFLLSGALFLVITNFKFKLYLTIFLLIVFWLAFIQAASSFMILNYLIWNDYGERLGNFLEKHEKIIIFLGKWVIVGFAFIYFIFNTTLNLNQKVLSISIAIVGGFVYDLIKNKKKK